MRDHDKRTGRHLVSIAAVASALMLAAGCSVTEERATTRTHGGPGETAAPEDSARQVGHDSFGTVAARSYRAGTGPFAVVEDRVDWVDVTRKRVVPVHLYAPAPSGAPGPLPAVVFSHGLGETRDSYGTLARHWASYGYIVVVLNHEGSDAEGLRHLRRNRLRDHYTLRFKDMTFAIDRLLAEDQDHPLIAGRVNPKQVGAAGHSMGSDTSMEMVGMTIHLPNGTIRTFSDPRVRAAIAMSPHVGSAADPPGARQDTQLKRAITRTAWDRITAPTMVLWGTKDREFDEPLLSNPDARRVIYERIRAKYKYMVDIAKLEHHAFTDTVPWYPAGPRDPRHYRWIAQATTAFLDAHVRGNPKALAWLCSGAFRNVGRGEITFRSGPGCAALAARATAGPDPVASIRTLILGGKQGHRELSVRVTYPRKPGVYPAILFSHYLGGSKDLYRSLVEHWSANGYVVLQPDHFDSSNLKPERNLHDIARWPERAADLRLVLNSLDAVDAALEPAHVRVDRSRIGAGGHYFGAYGAELLAGMRVFAAAQGRAAEFYDDRVRAVLLLSPVGRGQGLTQKSWESIRVPMLTVTGPADGSRRTGRDGWWRTEPYRFSAPGEKYLLWVEGLTGSYGGLVNGGNQDPNISAAVLRSSLIFWDAYLKDKAGAKAVLVSHALAAPGVSFKSR